MPQETPALLPPILPDICTKQKLDKVMQALNKLTNERIDASGTAIDDIANMIAVHNEAIDSLAESEVE